MQTSNVAMVLKKKKVKPGNDIQILQEMEIKLDKKATTCLSV